MRTLIHFGLFAFALTAVTRASADDDRDQRRHRQVVVSYDDAPRQVRTVRAAHDPPRAVYDSRRVVYQAPHRSPKAMHAARRDYFDQREDLEQITRIAERWDRATANRNGDAQWKVNRRLDAWLDREIRESVRGPKQQRHAQRVRFLSEELNRIERRWSVERSSHSRNRYSRGYYSRGYYSRGHYGRGQYAHRQRAYFTRKAEILDELVRLSERQLVRAEARLRRPERVSYVYR